MRWRFCSAGTVAAVFCLMAACAPAVAADAPAADRLIVAELFTSQGCSSCPPADALLRELAASRRDVLALGFHVTYWNNLGWADPYALPEATARQQRYAALLAQDSVYTPELVVAGRQGVIGSDRPAVLAAIADAATRPGSHPSLIATRAGGRIVIEIAAAGDASVPASVLAIGYDAERRTQVGRGENAGRALIEANIVRSVAPLGVWQGGDVVLRGDRPAGEQVAVLLQAADGRILAATRLP
jgi:hypothetical protein